MRRTVSRSYRRDVEENPVHVFADVHLVLELLRDIRVVHDERERLGAVRDAGNRKGGFVPAPSQVNCDGMLALAAKSVLVSESVVSIALISV